jgi:hypothetical protein
MCYPFILLLATLPAPLAMTGVTVIDATGAPARSGMTIVLTGGRITAVGRTDQVVVPPGARIVDATGKYVIPGLWDMHVHWYDEPSLALFPVHGVTGVRIMCGYPLHLRWRREIDDGMLLGPQLILAGPIVDGPDPVWPDSLRAANAAQGRQAVRTIQEQGYDCVKVYNFLPRSAYLGVAEEARRRRVRFVGHVPFAVSAAEASDAGQQSIEHLNGIALACSSRESELRSLQIASVRERGQPATALALRIEVQAEDSYDAAKAANLFACFVRNGTWVVPTLTVRQAHSRLKDLAAQSAGVRYLPPSLKRRWDSRRTATLKKLTPGDLTNFQWSLRKELELVGAMHRAGVRFLAGTDAGALGCLAGFSLHDELALFVEAGLTPLEALQTATRNPAEFLGQLEDQGTIKVGKRANLVLLDADPLADIRNTTRIFGVVVNGRLLLESDRRVLLEQIEAAARRKIPETPPGAARRYP